jgi:hypothetical protein
MYEEIRCLMCYMYTVTALNFISLAMLGAPSRACLSIFTWLLVLALCVTVCIAVEQVPSPPLSA